MRVEISKLPPCRVAYLRAVGPYGAERIPALWERFVGWMERRGLLTTDSLRLGIAHDSPRIVPPEQCRYDACLVVPAEFPADGAVLVTDLPGWELGLTEFVGTPAEVRPAGDALWAALASAAGPE